MRPGDQEVILTGEVAEFDSVAEKTKPAASVINAPLPV